jgi:hypothetical protein
MKGCRQIIETVTRKDGRKVNRCALVEATGVKGWYVSADRCLKCREVDAGNTHVAMTINASLQKSQVEDLARAMKGEMGDDACAQLLVRAGLAGVEAGRLDAVAAELKVSEAFGAKLDVLVEEKQRADDARKADAAALRS